MMNRALVTGGCGFVGSAIVRDLVEDGVAVRVFALPGETRENLHRLDVEVHEGDVLDPFAVRKAVRGTDTVFHAAALYLDWALDPTKMYEVNLGGTLNMLEASRRAGVERFVHTSSIVALGRPEPGRLGTEEKP